MSNFPESGKIAAAVVTGVHPFDVPAFHAVFRNIPDIDCYPQHMEDFVHDFGKVRSRYDVAVFYNMHQATPTEEGSWLEKAMKETLGALGETKQGIFVLHHGILAFPQWSFWSNLVGIEDRSFGYHIGQTIRVEVANPDHPITQGLSSWEMVDETYTMNSPGEDSETLLTVDYPKSMKAVGWTRRLRNAPVFCLQLGHDATAFENPNFRKVVGQGIRWCAGR